MKFLKFHSRKSPNQLSESDKYDELAKILRENSTDALRESLGTNGMNRLLRAPFDDYYSAISKLVKPDINILDLGSGTGRHSFPLVNKGARVILLDASETSLEISKRIYESEIMTMACDMKDIPLTPKSIDLITVCASMSYISFEDFIVQTRKLLRPGGSMVILDTLGGNSIYQAKRYFDTLTGKRSRFTFENIITLANIERLKKEFVIGEIKYFGSYSWICVPLSAIFNSQMALFVESQLEKLRPSNKGSFKFLLILKNKT